MYLQLKAIKNRLLRPLFPEAVTYFYISSVPSAHIISRVLFACGAERHSSSQGNFQRFGELLS